MPRDNFDDLWAGIAGDQLRSTLPQWDRAGRRARVLVRLLSNSGRMVTCSELIEEDAKEDSLAVMDELEHAGVVRPVRAPLPGYAIADYARLRALTVQALRQLSARSDSLALLASWCRPSTTK